jgi:hypothetical protein
VLIHQEIVNHYREESYEYLDAGTPLESFNKGIMHSLPKGPQQQQQQPGQPQARKARRKSF